MAEWIIMLIISGALGIAGIICFICARKYIGVPMTSNLLFLQAIEGFSFKRVGNEYHCIEHDSFVIKSDLHNWYWNSQGLCGRNAIDYYLIGGSPCTYWSIAQQNNRETTASGIGWKLFMQYVRALHEV